MWIFIDMKIAHTLPQKKLWHIHKYFSVFLPKTIVKKKKKASYALWSSQLADICELVLNSYYDKNSGNRNCSHCTVALEMFS